MTNSVFPVKTGIQLEDKCWIPAFAGMTIRMTNYGTDGIDKKPKIGYSLGEEIVLTSSFDKPKQGGITMKRVFFATLILVAALCRPAMSQTLSDLVGTWNVSKTGTDAENMADMALGNTPIWVIKPGPEPDDFMLEFYCMTREGSVFSPSINIRSFSFDNREITVVTEPSYSNQSFRTVTTYKITPSANGKRASGSYNEHKDMPLFQSMADNFVADLSASMGVPVPPRPSYLPPPDTDSRGAITLVKVSRSTKEPASRPRPKPAAPTDMMPASPYGGIGATPMPVMPYGGSGFMPAPMPMTPFPRPSHMFSEPIRHKSFCMMNKITCTNGCDPASYGLPKNYNRINACQASCEDSYARCMR